MPSNKSYMNSFSTVSARLFTNNGIVGGIVIVVGNPVQITCLLVNIVRIGNLFCTRFGNCKLFQGSIMYWGYNVDSFSGALPLFSHSYSFIARQSARILVLAGEGFPLALFSNGSRIPTKQKVPTIKNASNEHLKSVPAWFLLRCFLYNGNNRNPKNDIAKIVTSKISKIHPTTPISQFSNITLITLCVPYSFLMIRNWGLYSQMTIRKAPCEKKEIRGIFFRWVEKTHRELFNLII